jgi:hypothetical protein
MRQFTIEYRRLRSQDKMLGAAGSAGQAGPKRDKKGKGFAKDIEKDQRGPSMKEIWGQLTQKKPDCVRVFEL